MVMAELGDRDRGKRRRRRGGGRKERDRDRDPDSGLHHLTRPPIILAKPGPDKHLNSDIFNNFEENINSKPAFVAYGREDMGGNAAFISYSRDERPGKPGLVAYGGRDDIGSKPTAIPYSHSLPVLLHAEGVSPPNYTAIQQRPAIPNTGYTPVLLEGASQARLAPPPEMTQSIKIVDDGLNWCDSGMEMLRDQTNYLVIGILGQQGVGKSSLLSCLAGNEPTEPSRSLVFRPQGKDAREVCGHQTVGVDMYVTGERHILLDSQPVLSASVLDHMIHHEKKYSADFSTGENCVEMQSLQIASFMMTVCNVLVVVLDWFVDLDLVRLVQNAEMLKPATPSSAASHEGSGGASEEDYSPHVVFVLNRAGREEYSVENFTGMQTLLGSVLDESRLRYKGGVHLGKSNLLPGLNARTVSSLVNLYVLPERETTRTSADGVFGLLEGYQGHPSYERMLRGLSSQLFALPRHPLTHTTLSEKNWYHYAARTWDAIKKSQLLAEYNRLLP